MRKIISDNNILRKKALLCVCAGVIPCAIFVISMAFVGVAPFGDNTILLRDSVGQYIDFVSYFKTVLLGENNIFYTFSKNLGGDMFGLSAYYLLSPFNLLFVFSTDENIPLFYTAVTVLKLSACGITFYLASQNRYGAKLRCLIFSTSYALMAYNIIFQWNIMWLDGVIVLPLLGLGVEKIWSGKSPLLYILSLAYALITNFYIGYMLCIASVLFSAVRFAIHGNGIGERFRFLGRYVLCSLIGGFGSAFVCLPAFLSLRNGRAQSIGTSFSLNLSFAPEELAAKLVAGSGGPEQMGSGLPHIFCGTLVLFLVLIFFTSNKVSWKLRAAVFAVVGIVVGSFLFEYTDTIWHGFSRNNSFNFRYSFILSYILIVTAQYTVVADIVGGIKHRVVAALPLVAVYVFLLFKGYDYVPMVGIMLAVGVLIALIIICGRENRKKLSYFFIYFICLAEIGLNCYLLLASVVGETTTLRISSWSGQSEVAAAVDYVKEYDTGLYRMEKTFNRSHNDAMFFSYNGISHFSSTEASFVPAFMEKMGLKNHQVWAYYNKGSTAEVDSLLGIKYVLSKSDLSDAKGYELLSQNGSIGIYKNSNALPLAFVSSSKITEVSMEQKDYFSLHNDIWSGICGYDTQILHNEEDYSVELINLSDTTDKNGNSVYTSIDNTLESKIRYVISVERQMPLYFYFSAPSVQSATIYVNGQNCGSYFGVYRWDMTNAGTYSQGEDVVIEIVPATEKLTVTKAMFCYEDEQILEDTVNNINSESAFAEKASSSRILGEVSLQEDGYLMFTIPYDEGWKLIVDGSPVETVKVLNTFLAAEISEGSHDFVLRYRPVGFAGGCVLSGLAWLVFSVFMWIGKTRIQQKG